MSLIEMSVAIVILASILLTMAYLFFRTDHLKIKWDKFAQFFAFMCFVLVVRHAWTDGKSPGLADVKTWEYTLVWWEDLIFMTPMYYAFHKWGRNKYTIGLAIALSLWFGSGHIYHGITGALTSCLYPYFISYYYAKRTSIGTVMACHVLYDLMLFYSVRVLAQF
jgi:hypothetical protein